MALRPAFRGTQASIPWHSGQQFRSSQACNVVAVMPGLVVVLVVVLVSLAVLVVVLDLSVILKVVLVLSVVLEDVLVLSVVLATYITAAGDVVVVSGTT